MTLLRCFLNGNLLSITKPKYLESSMRSSSLLSNLNFLRDVLVQLRYFELKYIDFVSDVLIAKEFFRHKLSNRFKSC